MGCGGSTSRVVSPAEWEQRNERATEVSNVLVDSNPRKNSYIPPVQEYIEGISNNILLVQQKVGIMSI